MVETKDILFKIKESIRSKIPDAEVILYGSYARGEQTVESDIDLLILLDVDQISEDDEKALIYPLYDIEFELGTIISPLVLSKKEWETKHCITPFYENVVTDGVHL